MHIQHPTINIPIRLQRILPRAMYDFLGLASLPYIKALQVQTKQKDKGGTWKQTCQIFDLSITQFQQTKGDIKLSIVHYGPFIEDILKETKGETLLPTELLQIQVRCLS